jgi:hypothetical protein
MSYNIEETKDTNGWLVSQQGWDSEGGRGRLFSPRQVEAGWAKGLEYASVLCPFFPGSRCATPPDNEIIVVELSLETYTRRLKPKV